MASDFLTGPLNEMFGSRSKRAPVRSEWVASRNGTDFPIHRGKLFSVEIDGRTISNSRFGDLRIHLEDDLGCTVEQRFL
jgi:hypothetical protein